MKTKNRNRGLFYITLKDLFHSWICVFQVPRDLWVFSTSECCECTWSHYMVLHRLTLLMGDYVKKYCSSRSHSTLVTLKDTSRTMALARLSLLSLLFVSLVGSQPVDDSEVLSNLATSDLSFPWSRLRLPRYLSKSFFSSVQRWK